MPAQTIVMTSSGNVSARNHAWTVAAIAALAYMLANIAHETIGHGVGLLLAGGRSGILTTTRLIVAKPVPAPAWRIFDLGGPAGNLACAGMAWLGGRFLSGARPAARLFLSLAMAFSLYWAFGYLLLCGVTGRGDWMALLPSHNWLGRVVFVLAGLALYKACNRITARELCRILSGAGASTRIRAGRLVWIAWLAGGVIATAGAAFDPRGSLEMLNSGALSSFAAAIGLLRVPGLLKSVPHSVAPATEPTFIPCSVGWLLAAAIASYFFIAVLGKGIPWHV